MEDFLINQVISLNHPLEKFQNAVSLLQSKEYSVFLGAIK